MKNVKIILMLAFLASVGLSDDLNQFKNDPFYICGVDYANRLLFEPEVRENEFVFIDNELEARDRETGEILRGKRKCIADKTQNAQLQALNKCTEKLKQKQEKGVDLKEYQNVKAYKEYYKSTFLPLRNTLIKECDGL